jgi:hypothetical protein
MRSIIETSFRQHPPVMRGTLSTMDLPMLRSMCLSLRVRILHVTRELCLISDPLP